MEHLPLAGHTALAINLNSPGTYLNWDIFTISVANLVLIGLMIVVFFAAILIPFGHRRRDGR